MIADDAEVQSFLMDFENDDVHGFSAKEMYGESAGAGFVGASHFEPVSDADTGIAQRCVHLTSITKQRKQSGL